MTTHEVLDIGFFAGTGLAIACNSVEWSILKKFAKENSLAFPQGLVVGPKAIRSVKDKLPDGQIRTRLRLLHTGAWIAWLGSGVILAFTLLHGQQTGGVQ